MKAADLGAANVRKVEPTRIAEACDMMSVKLKAIAMNNHTIVVCVDVRMVREVRIEEMEGKGFTRTRCSKIGALKPCLVSHARSTAARPNR